ncbi:MAG: heterodisulfide reductase-related iron-sulfur binding cluster [Pseudomonadota bacterium]
MQDTDPAFPAAGRGTALSDAEQALSACTMCGLCNAVCPTFAVSGDERESPRGRIAMMRYLIGREGVSARASTRAEAAATVRTHLDRCATCLACAPACPENVDYAGALSAIRGYVGTTPRAARRSRWSDLVSMHLSDPIRLRRMLRFVRWTRPLSGLFSRSSSPATDALADRAAQVQFWDGEFRGPGTAVTSQDRKARVLLLAGCTQQVLRPTMTDAAIRLLGRRGIDVVVAAGAGCCGAIDAQLGRASLAQAHAAANLTAWAKVLASEPIDYIVTTSAACGQRVRRYGELFDDVLRPGSEAASLVKRVRDITDLVSDTDIGAPVRWFSLRVGYLGSCSLRAGGAKDDTVTDLLSRSGFSVRPLKPSMACCGGIGAYPIVEPDLAQQMRTSIAADVARAGIDLLAVHDVGCLTHLANHSPAPVAHIVELLDWAHGGPTPPGLRAFNKAVREVPKPQPRNRADDAPTDE